MKKSHLTFSVVIFWGLSLSYLHLIDASKLLAFDTASVHPTVEWILACRVPGEGFGCFPGDSAFTSRTGMAIEALAELGTLESIEQRESLIAWLRSRQNPDGGFFEAHGYYGAGFNLPWGSESALEPTYWALRALQLLGSNPVDPETAAKFILSLQQPEGAFDASEYTLGNPLTGVYTTCWAIQSLRILGEPVPDSAAVVGWLIDQQNTSFRRGGFALSPDNYYFATTLGTYFAVKALTLLGSAPIRPDEVKPYLLSSYGQESDGGFEIGHGDGWNNYDHYSRMEDTYAAVATLELLGDPLSDNDSSRAKNPATDCIAWVGSTLNPDGGFGRFGVTDQTPVKSPSDMRSTWAAVRSLSILKSPMPRPENRIRPAKTIQTHIPVFRHPVVNCDDPVDVYAFRRIAEPIYMHYINATGSDAEAIGMLSRWTRAAVGPQNYQGERRSMRARRHLMHSWGQCGTMSIMLQALSTSVDHAARGAYAAGDANAEVLITEKDWDKPHWVCYIPITNEFVPLDTLTPAGTRDGWSALDLVINNRLRAMNWNAISITRLGDYHYWRVWMQTIDSHDGVLGIEARIDTSMTYGDSIPKILYPDENW